MNVRNQITLLSFLVPTIAWAAVSPLANHAFDENCTTGMQAFEKTVHAKVIRDCKLCHNGNTGAPAFAVDDLSQSYFRILNYVDFSSANGGTLGFRAGNGHCGMSNCNGDSGKEMVELIKQWYDGGEKDCALNGRFFSTEVAVPTDLPVGPDGFKTMSWDLKTIDGKLSAATFSVEAQQFVKSDGGSIGGAYRFRKPRITTGIQSYHVQNVKILVNRKFDIAANAYTLINKTVSPQKMPNGAKQAPPYAVLSSETMIVLQDLAQGDQLSISFDDISLSDPVTCKAQALFSNRVQPYFAKQCASCHGDSNNSDGIAPANMFFNMAINADQACASTRQRINFRDPILSPVLDYAARGKFGHPVTLNNPAGFFADFKSWVDSEK